MYICHTWRGIPCDFLKHYFPDLLQKHEQIEASQPEPYSDIVITKGANFGGVINDHC